MKTATIAIKSLGPLATRENGARARALILAALKEAEAIVLDFSGNVLITPSFADECFGLTAVALGREQFKKRVRLQNLRTQDEVLISHVVARALKEKEKRVA
jgi:hypothetical protein